MKFTIKTLGKHLSDEELLSDLKDVFNKLTEKGEKISKRSYNEIGKYSAFTYASRFGSWNTALAKANIPVTREINITNENLLENIKDVWIIKGKQPTYRDIDGPTSKYSASTYQERFGSWNRALEAFSDYINSAFEDTNSDKQNRIEDNHSDFNQKARRKTRRDISERMRFSVLLRDGFRCQSCGRSPLKSPGVELQVDHIIPWSKGGETVQSNLQTKCKKCNLGKGNAFEK